MSIRWLRWSIIITVICAAVLVAGYRLAQSEPEAAAAAPAVSASVPVKNVSLVGQATSPAEGQTYRVQPVLESTILYQDANLGYHLSYPAGWKMVPLSANVVLFQAAEGLTQVKVELAGPLSADGLTLFVDRSLATNPVLSRQTLTVHGQPAERVMVFADAAGGQATTFYIQSGTNVYTITGVGQQSAIESVARSFNAPQVVAQR